MLRPLIVNAIPAHLGGILTYTNELARRLPMAMAPARTTLVAPEIVAQRVAHDSTGLLRMETVEEGRIAAETRLLYSLLKRDPSAVLFATANFTLIDRQVPQLLLVRNAVYLDPLTDAEHSPHLAPAARIGLEIRRGLTLASCDVARTIMTPSRTMRDLVVAQRPDLASKIVVNPYGVSLQNFSAAATRRVPSERGTLRIICHSLIGYHKPVWPILAAVAKIRRRGIRATLTLLDDPKKPAHGPPTSQDVEWANRLAGEPWLRCIARVRHDELPQLLAEHDVFAWHTLTESFGHPYLEAMAAGLSSVITDIPIARELCGDCATFVRPFEPDLMADSLEKAATDPSERVAHGERAQAHVRASASTWADHFSRCADLIKTLS